MIVSAWSRPLSSIYHANITEWLRSARASTKTFGCYWFAAVALMGDFADVWTSVRSVAGWLPGATVIYRMEHLNLDL